MFTRGRRNFQKLLIMEHSRADGVPKQFNPKIGRYKSTRSSDSLLHTLTYSYPHISLEDVLIKDFGIWWEITNYIQHEKDSYLSPISSYFTPY